MSDHQKPSVEPKAVRWIIIGLLVICGSCVLIDFFYEKHGHLDFENIPGFHAVYGFISFWFLVLLAKPMRKLLIRSEDYYEREGGDDAE